MDLSKDSIQKGDSVLLVEDDQTLFQELKKLEHWDFFVTGIDDFSAVMDMKKQILKLLLWMFNYLNTMDFIGVERLGKYLMSPSYSYHHVIIQWTKS